MVNNFHPIISMASSVAVCPPHVLLDENDTLTSFLKRARAKAKEENVPLSRYLAAMIWHYFRGHDLSKIHFYQDGSGDTYNEEILDKSFKQFEAESEAGLSYRCETAEEGLALLKKWKEEAIGEREKNV
jgi:hypothetical protein